MRWSVGYLPCREEGDGVTFMAGQCVRHSHLVNTKRVVHYTYTPYHVMSCWFLYSRSVNERQQLHDVLIMTLTTTWIVYVISGKTCSDYCKSVTQQSVWETVRNCYTTSPSWPRQHKLTTNRNSGVWALQSTFLSDQTTVTSAYF